MGACARIIAMLLCAAFASEANAQTTAYAPGDGSPNQVVLSIPVTASVGFQCGFTSGGVPNGTHDEPNFDDHAWSHDFVFTIDCSGPSRLAVVSTNGALKTSGTVPSGYTTLAPYDVTLNVTRNAGGPVTGTCPVADLTTGGSCTFVGPASLTQGLLVPSASQSQPGSYLRVSAPAYAGANVLTNGTYADTLVVTLSPAT